MFTVNVEHGITSMGLGFEGMPEAFPILRDLINQFGHVVAPRSEPTRELLGMTFTIDDAVHRGVPVGCGRKVGKKMQAIDGANNLAGQAFPDVFIRLAPILDRFADDLDLSDEDMTNEIVRTAGVLPAVGGEPMARFHQGMYGPRIADQLLAMEEQLRRDPSTRQAVASLWREEDRNPKWKDRPCTTEFQLMLRDDGLHMFVFMRANDLWTGTCYDVFQFGQIQAAMAHVLQVPVATYHHHATSLHIYERDLESFANVKPWVEWESDEERKQFESLYPNGNSTEHHYAAVYNERETFGPRWDSLEPGHYRSMAIIQARFRRMLYSIRAGEVFDPANEVEAWYYEILREGS